MDCGSCQCRSGIGAFSISIALRFEAVYASTRMVPPGENPFSVRIVVTVIVTPLHNKRGMSAFPECGRSNSMKNINLTGR